MTQTQESFETIKKRYVKANSEYKQKILRKYGVNDINKLSRILKPVVKEVKVGKNELAAILMNNPHIDLKVCFNKQADEKEICRELVLLHKDSMNYLTFEKEIKQIVKDAINGIKTIRFGNHGGKLDYNGRLYFQDKEKEQIEGHLSNSKMILISLNHLNWVEVNGVKYILK